MYFFMFKSEKDKLNKANQTKANKISLFIDFLIKEC